MVTAVAIRELPAAMEAPALPLPETVWQIRVVGLAPKMRFRTAVLIAAKWAPVVALLAVAGLWSRVTPFEVVLRFIVDGGAIVMLARALLVRTYAVAVVAASLAILLNPLAPVFELYGGWQRAVFVLIATPFLALLIWRDMTTARQNSPGSN